MKQTSESCIHIKGYMSRDLHIPCLIGHDMDPPMWMGRTNIHTDVHPILPISGCNGSPCMSIYTQEGETHLCG